MNRHTQAGTAQSEVMSDDFVDGYAVVGPASACVDRLQEIAELGIDKVVVIGVSPGSDRDDARVADEAMASGVLAAR